MDKHYLYQNAETGKTSNAPLPAPVLCRMLNSKNIRTINLESLVLPYDPNTQTFEEWVQVKQIPLLSAAGSLWYYSFPTSLETEGKVGGPVSCGELSQKLSEASILDKQIRSKGKVYNASLTLSTEQKSAWKLIQDEPGLNSILKIFGEKDISSKVIDKMPTLDSTIMVYDEGEDNDKETSSEIKNHAAELEAFLASTSALPNPDQRESDEDEEGYTSDGGTEYLKCRNTNQWIVADLMRSRKRPIPSSNSNLLVSKTIDTKPKKRKKKANFSAKNAKNWVYISGLPTDTNEDEVGTFFAKAGIIDLDPETQLPKIKLYRNKKDGSDGSRAGSLKGDASICYARVESVDLAIQILDGSMYRATSTNPLNVVKAKFEQKGDTFVKNSISVAKRKVAKLAAVQAVCWDEGENGRITGGMKGLRIIVLKGMFEPKDIIKDSQLKKLESRILSECSKNGDVEKITVFSENPAGVVIVKFTQPAAASSTIKAYQNIDIGGRRVEATFWDGVTDYTIHDEEKEKLESEKRQEEFGAWLDNQQLPEHLQLRVENS